jgi:heme A synthase
MTIPTARADPLATPRQQAARHRPTIVFTTLVGLTSLTVFLQAVLAGEFVDRDNRDGWITAHGVVADVSWVLALATAGVAWRFLRRDHRPLWLASAALFLLDLSQAGIGHLITDYGYDGLIVVHIPVALLLFALAVWLTMRAAALHRT